MGPIRKDLWQDLVGLTKNKLDSVLAILAGIGIIKKIHSGKTKCFKIRLNLPFKNLTNPTAATTNPSDAQIWQEGKYELKLEEMHNAREDAAENETPDGLKKEHSESKFIE